MSKKIIAFAGRKRSGKTRKAKMLQEKENAVIITIADYLKHLCCELMNMSYDELIIKKDNGYVFNIVPNERWFKIISERANIKFDDVKNELQNTHITSIRQLLQVIGTDVIRKYNENWHVNKMIEEIKSYPDDKLITIDDVRFPNEKEAITSLSGQVFFIVRPNVSEVSNHVSETSLKWQDFDERHIILNAYIGEDKLKEEFLKHYKDGFKKSFYKSILLNENQRYVKCSNFGYKPNENDELFNDLLEQLKNDKQFYKFGIISYVTDSIDLARRYEEEVHNSLFFLDREKFWYKTINPLITENLKMFFG